MTLATNRSSAKIVSHPTRCSARRLGRRLCTGTARFAADQHGGSTVESAFQLGLLGGAALIVVWGAGSQLAAAARAVANLVLAVIA